MTECERIERKYSRFNSDSVVCKINQAGHTNSRVRLDAESAELINLASVAYVESDGLFDITSGHLSLLWKTPTLPKQKDIDNALSLVGFKLVDWEEPYIRLSRPGMKIDLGGLGKEYAVDKVVSILHENGVRNGMVNFGGDIFVLGPHPNAKPWQVGIADPQNPCRAVVNREIFSGALATSGDAERFIEIAGQRYCHIINPLTGFPVQSPYSSVSIYDTDSCMVAGLLSTIAFLKAESAKVWLQDNDVDFILVEKP